MPVVYRCHKLDLKLAVAEDGTVYGIADQLRDILSPYFDGALDKNRPENKNISRTWSYGGKDVGGVSTVELESLIAASSHLSSHHFYINNSSITSSLSFSFLNGN